MLITTTRHDPQTQPFRAEKLTVELPKFVKTLTDRAVAEGRGGDGYAAMIEQFRKPTTVRP